jgi:membrane protein involved in colicin uptake
MADANDNPETLDTPTPADTTGDAPKDKTYTQSELEAIITGRLSAHEKALRKQLADDAKKAADKAKLDAEGLAKAEKEEAEQKAADAENRAKLASYRADLKGEVVDVTAALKLVDDEKHVKDGAVDVKALLKQYPFLAKTQTPSAPGGGGAHSRDAGDPMSSLAAARAADGVN